MHGYLPSPPALPVVTRPLIHILQWLPRTTNRPLAKESYDYTGPLHVPSTLTMSVKKFSWSDSRLITQLVHVTVWHSRLMRLGHPTSPTYQIPWKNCHINPNRSVARQLSACSTGKSSCISYIPSSIPNAADPTAGFSLLGMDAPPDSCWSWVLLATASARQSLSLHISTSSNPTRCTMSPQPISPLGRPRLAELVWCN